MNMPQWILTKKQASEPQNCSWGTSSIPIPWGFINQGIQCCILYKPFKDLFFFSSEEKIVLSVCCCLKKPFESIYSQGCQSYYTNKFYLRCFGKQAFRSCDWTTLSLSFCKMAKTPKQHKEGNKFWILHMSCSPRSCVIGVSFQGRQVGFHLPASVSPWITHTVPCSTFRLPCQLGWPRVMLIGLLIFLHTFSFSLLIFSSVMTENTAWVCLNTCGSLCVGKVISTGVSIVLVESLFKYWHNHCSLLWK